MGYNAKQYDAARDFVQKGDDNVVNPLDKLRVQTYNLYEDIYINSTYNLKIILRGVDQVPMLLPSGRKLVDATKRFLCVNLDYLVEGVGDVATQTGLEDWFKNFFKREIVKSKFDSSEMWGLVRGDSVLMLYASPNKAIGERISIAELDPRQVFEIEGQEGSLVGYYLVERVQDFRDKKDTAKQVAKRHAFRKQVDNDGNIIPDAPIQTEITYWEIGKWDDRDPDDETEQVNGGPGELPLAVLDGYITELPIYKWPNKPMQNTTWGTSQLAGLETLLYGLNQSLTDEDATMVFQGLGMYMTTAAPPLDPNTGEITDWNIGPMQIIEIGQDQKFERVTGIETLEPFQNHMAFIDEKGLSEGSGIPEVAIGRVDVQSAESGISLKLQFMPLLAQNADKELLAVNKVDQLFHDIVTMWLPTYETETFGNVDAMSEMSVVCIFDDPMPVDRNATIQETLLLQTSNLILTAMAVARLRSLGWKYPTIGPNGEELTDDDIAQMLTDQAAAAASAADPFAAELGSNLSSFDSATGTTPPQGNVPAPGQATPGQKKTVPLSGG